MSSLFERVLRDQGRDREAINNIKDDVAKLEVRLSEIGDKLDQLLALVEQGKGGYKAAAWIGGGIVTLVGTVTAMIEWFRH